MSLKFSKISSKSPGGERDLSLDVSAYIESGETISTEDVVSLSSDVTVSTVTESAGTISCHVAVTAGAAEQDVNLDWSFEGDSGTKETIRTKLPIVTAVTS